MATEYRLMGGASVAPDAIKNGDPDPIHLGLVVGVNGRYVPLALSADGALALADELIRAARVVYRRQEVNRG